jgi:Tfp pilus assembly protein PilO
MALFDTSAEIQVGGQSIPAIYIAAALPVLALLYLGYAFYMSEDPPGIMARIEALDAQEAGLVTKRQEADDLRRRTQEIDTVKAEIEALEKSITLLKQQIPGDAQVSSLLFDIERMTKASQGALFSFTPQTMRAFSGEGAGGTGTSDIQELPVAIKATATYPEVINFLAQLNNYERKLNISNLSLTPAANTKGGNEGDQGTIPSGFKNTLNVEFTLLAYVLKTNGAPVQP